MANPIVAIVGRPNVGKSTLFNRVAGERISIVEDTPGVTRDRIYAHGEWLGKHFSLIDTGGIEMSDQPLSTQIREQAEVAIDEADVIVMVVDVRSGVTDADEQVAQILYRSDKPDFFAVCLKNMLYQICYCGFSVCAGNADKLHFLCRPAVYVCAHNSVCRSGIRHQHLLLNSGIAFRNNPRSSAAFCRTGIFVTVACAAFYTDKHGTRFHLAGIAGYIFYFHILYCTGIFNIP